MLDNAIDAGMEARHCDAGAEARHTEEKQWRAMLRNKKINYSKGIFFVTSQAAFNKSIFGAIVGQRCELNELGRAVHESLGSLGGRYKGVEVIEYTVMPNHIHALIRIAGMEARHTDADMEARHTDADKKTATPRRSHQSYQPSPVHKSGLYLRRYWRAGADL